MYIANRRDNFYFPDKYIVIDLETTGLSLSDKIIEIAAAKYDAGELVDSYETLVNPCCHIPMNASDVNNIYDDMVSDEPTIDEVIPSFCEFIGDQPMVGHNVSFDYSYIYRDCKKNGIILSNSGIDTLQLTKYLFPELKSHSLNKLCQYLGICNDQEHRALSDVGATAELYEICKKYYLDGVKPKTYTSSIERIAQRANVKLADIRPTIEVPKNGPLFGKIVVFTGEMSIERQEAVQMAVNAGATVKSSISKKVNYLVVGTQDIDIVGCDGLSSKQEKAIEYNKKGVAEIKFLDEQEFMEKAALVGVS